MEGLHIIPSVDRKASDILDGVPEDKIVHVKGGDMELVGIPRGTEGGQVTVAWIALLPDHETPVVLETTFALLHTGLRGIAAANDIDLETNRVRGT